MKRISSAFLIGIISLSSFGQIARWKVKPSFDDARPLGNGLIEVKVGNKYGLYNSVGENILPVGYDSIGDFTDDVAMLFNESRLAGFIDSEGKHIDLTGTGYNPVPSQEFFSGGFLTVNKDDKYYYIDKSGKEVAGPFAKTYPYYDGYAAISCYAGIHKKPDETYLAFIDENQTITRIPEFEKSDDLCFISSFRDGNAVCVYKRKAYFLTDSLTISPISTDTIATKKSIVAFENKNVIPQPIDGGYVIYAKNAALTFNKQMQLEKIESGENLIYSYKPTPKTVRPITSKFADVSKDGMYGLTYNNSVILPAQFSDIRLLEEKYALVKLDGKWGMITVDPDNQFQFKLNNNEHIGFNHRFYIAKLATLMPSYIKCNNTTVYSKSLDCEIQVESRNEIENIERNTLTYDCKLSIPESLSDTLALQEYTYALKYDGLQSIDYKVSIPEWYVKYYEVELSNTKFTVNPNDTITVEFDLVKTDAARNDDTNYFKTVELITPENDNIPLNKITENHYSFRIGSGDRERLSFIVRIKEIDCPAIEYPFEMVFTKPAPKSKDKSLNVTINRTKSKGQKSEQSKQLKQEDKADRIFVPK